MSASVNLNLVQQSLLQAWTALQEAGSPSFKENRHIKVINLSVLSNGRLYLQENISRT